MMDHILKDERTANGRPLLPGLREIMLTPDEAAELARRLDDPAAQPARPPRDLPEGDPSLLFKNAR